jgi:hypothetical protein
MPCFATQIWENLVLAKALTFIKHVLPKTFGKSLFIKLNLCKARLAQVCASLKPKGKKLLSKTL